MTPHPLIPPVFVAALLLAPAAGARADSLGSTNQGALQRAFALPALGAAPADADGRWRLAVDLSSEYVLDQEAGEELLLDGETQHYALEWRQAWGARGEWSLELPLLHTGGGFMDDLIEGWHDAFGLPNGGREDAPTDRYCYRYLRDGQTVFDIQDGGTRLGDVRLGAGWALRQSLMLRAQLKLPTGDEQRLTGGNAGLAVWGDLQLPFEPGSDFSGFVSAGLSANDKAEVLGDAQRTLLPFAGAGLGVRVLPGFELLGQLSVHAPPYEGLAVDALDRPGVLLALGTRLCSDAGLCAEVSFQEDLAVGAAPDFSLRFALMAE